MLVVLLPAIAVLLGVIFWIAGVAVWDMRWMRRPRQWFARKFRAGDRERAS